MAFFGEHGNLGSSTPVVEEGPYICRLKEVLLTEGKVFEAGKLPKPQFRWNFDSLEAADDEGNPYKFSTFTGRSYGYDKADLTKLIDGMMGRRLTPEEFNALDLSDLVGDETRPRKWRVMITTGRNGAGKEYNEIVSVKPVQKLQGSVSSRPSPAKTIEPEADNSDLEDPFDTDNA